MLEQAQLALLACDADDAAGLDLRPNGDTLSMRKAAMQLEELVTYEARWSAPLMMLARRLAEALEKVRGFARRLMQREQELDDRDDRLVAQEQDAEHDRPVRASEHAAALA